MEIWKNVVGYEDEYEASSLGNIRRKRNNLKTRVGSSGYIYLSLSKNGTTTTKLAHRVIAEAFLENKEDKEQVNHKDCNKENNNISNLEWNTRAENRDHAIMNGRERDQRGEKNNMSRLTKEDVLHIRRLINEGVTAYKVHKEHYPHIHQQTIYGIKQRRIWKWI